MARGWTEMVAGNGPIRRILPVDVRESMANGGGPACLRLRVVADPDHGRSPLPGRRGEARPYRACVEAHWPERIAPDDLADPALGEQIEAARTALLDLLGLPDLS